MKSRKKDNRKQKNKNIKERNNELNILITRLYEDYALKKSMRNTMKGAIKNMIENGQNQKIQLRSIKKKLIATIRIKQ